jgi:hypothetical protein
VLSAAPLGGPWAHAAALDVLREHIRVCRDLLAENDAYQKASAGA